MTREAVTWILGVVPRHIDLAVQAGSTAAIVGASGRGRPTVAGLPKELWRAQGPAAAETSHGQRIDAETVS